MLIKAKFSEKESIQFQSLKSYVKQLLLYLQNIIKDECSDDEELVVMFQDTLLVLEKINLKKVVNHTTK